MQQSKRKQIGILLILIGVIVIILIVYFGFIKSAPLPSLTTPTATTTAQLPTGTAATATPSDAPRNYQQYNVASEAPHQTNATDLAKLAMAFASRFGSYSNQSDYGNFTDLKIFMTDNMAEWVDTYIVQLKAKDTGPGYYGITTRAISADVKSFDDKAGTAQVTVLTERSESADTIGGGKAYAQNLDLTFKKVNGDWLADRAYWEK